MALANYLPKMEKEFRIKENGFSEIRGSTLKLTILVIILLVVLPTIIILSIRSNGFTTNLETVLITILTLISISSFGICIGMKRAKKQFESFKLIIDKNQIIRKQLYVKVKEISIPINEVKSITINKKGGITIIGKNDSPLQIIFIPKQIESFEKLKKMLSEILPIK